MMKKKVSRNPVAAIAFLCYGALMLYLLFVRNRTGEYGVPYWEQVKQNCNFIPFHTMGNYWDILSRPEYYLKKWETYAAYQFQARAAVVNLLGNVGMFVPFGAFLPAMFPKLQRAWKALMIAVLSIVSVEVVQLFTLRGSCDVDDLLLNTLGVAIGYGAWRLWHFCRRKHR